ncbi:cupin domain-containing protein [Pseudomaricurvus sp.]|uniref:AraC family transcriptional regulator n=1 Tax=Pseudomaricurvus sp. TaxID=2004510 RepID=UPI003F6ACA1D
MATLNDLIQEMELQAEVFFSGGLCGLQAFTESETAGHLHLLRSGAMTLYTDQGHKLRMETPTVLFIPGGARHRLQVDDSQEAELVCATVSFPIKHKTLLTDVLPKFVCVETSDNDAIYNTAQWLFQEAFQDDQGKQVVINRLCDVFMVYLLRHVVDQGTVNIALLTACSHSSLAPLMVQLQENLEQDWTVNSMAEAVAMSRSKFAALFKETVGQAPMDYLTDLRMTKAQGLLKMQRPVSLVANTVGYEDASSLTRVFKKRFGLTPKQWLNKHFRKP